ncbi:transcription initiation factor TFIID subunit 4-like [Heterocephalus glaber]|uniref:Transcription initiation factor TFIID subunit 4-like n=1 Tax=Heterocephalus glaber TaxID=10181 RepID=A0AAX6SJ31_HETGA|nr:transcription initiation factor TFIID subunit 4-like [Heterocephalus glaber]
MGDTIPSHSFQGFSTQGRVSGQRPLPRQASLPKTPRRRRGAQDRPRSRTCPGPTVHQQHTGRVSHRGPGGAEKQGQRVPRGPHTTPATFPVTPSFPAIWERLSQACCPASCWLLSTPRGALPLSCLQPFLVFILRQDHAGPHHAPGGGRGPRCLLLQPETVVVPCCPPRGAVGEGAHQPPERVSDTEYRAPAFPLETGATRRLPRCETPAPPLSPAGLRILQGTQHLGPNDRTPRLCPQVQAPLPLIPPAPRGPQTGWGRPLPPASASAPAVSQRLHSAQRSWKGDFSEGAAPLLCSSPLRGTRCSGRRGQRRNPRPGQTPLRAPQRPGGVSGAPPGFPVRIPFAGAALRQHLESSASLCAGSLRPQV